MGQGNGKNRGFTRARRLPFRRANSNINVNVLALVNVKIAKELNLPSVVVLRKGVFYLFILLKLRSAVQFDTGTLTNAIRE